MILQQPENGHASSVTALYIVNTTNSAMPLGTLYGYGLRPLVAIGMTRASFVRLGVPCATISIQF
jgi:hypothetical protein